MSCWSHSFAHAEWRATEFDVMGTRFEMEIWERSEVKAGVLFDSVRQQLVKMEQLLSPYIETSDVSRINLAAGTGMVEVDKVTFEIIERSLYFSRLSKGQFDISFATIGKQYDYPKKQKPDAEQLERLTPLINYRLINLQEISVKEEQALTQKFSIGLKKKGMAIDLGGIAKGFAVDSIIQFLVGKSIESAAVSLGGDSRFLGDRGKSFSEGESENHARIPWIVAIKHPRGGEQNRPYALRIPMINAAFSTSGDYERYFIDDSGERVHHIIDTKTGKSASDVVSVSIIGKQSIDCDALSTTVFVLGVDKGLALVESIEGYDAVVIDQDGKLHYSSGLK